MKTLTAILMLFVTLTAGCAGAEKNAGSGGATETQEAVTDSAPQQRPQPTVLTPQQAQQLIAGGNVEIVDLRSTESFDKGRLEGAGRINHEEILEKYGRVFPDKNQTILLYCQDGRESTDSANALAGLGYKNVYVLEGGIDNWQGPIVNWSREINFGSSGIQPQNTYEPFSYTMEQAIYPGTEVFTFIVDWDYATEYREKPAYDYQMLGPGWFIIDDYQAVRTITVKNAAGATVQVITGLETTRIEEPPLKFEDWNFDVYTDMCLFSHLGGTMGNWPAYYWLWDPLLKQFVQNDDLMGMIAPWVDTEKKRVWDGTSGNPYYLYSSYYEYKDGRFIKVWEKEYHLIGDLRDSDNYWQATETDLVTGEVTVTRESPW